MSHPVAAFEVEDGDHHRQADDERRREDALHDERDEHPREVEPLLLIATLELFFARRDATTERLHLGAAGAAAMVGRRGAILKPH